MPKLFLHIGYPKTGTSSLQKFFSDNFELLKQRGILYPVTGRLNNAHYLINFSLNIGAGGKTEQTTDVNLLRENLRAEVSASGCDNILISSEYFISAGALSTVREFFADYDVTVVMYLRRHDHALESAFNQSVKSTEHPPWSPNIESFVLYQLSLGSVPYDYLPTLRKWAATFGSDHILVRPFEQQQNKPDLYGDFLNLLGITNSENFLRPQEKINLSMPFHVAMVIDAVQRSNEPRMVKQWMISVLTQNNIPSEAPTDDYLLPPALRNALIAKFRHSYTVIAKEFLGRPNGKLFEEPDPNRRDTWTPPSPPSAQDITDMFLRAIGPHLR